MTGETTTIEFDLDNEQVLRELTYEIKKKKIKIGEDEFLLKVFISHSTNDFLYASFLFLLTLYFSKIIEGSNRKNKGDYNHFRRFYDETFLTINKSFDTERLENKIEKEFKVKIDLEKKNPLDEVFGIWKDENISLDKIREKAWQRNN